MLENVSKQDIDQWLRNHPDWQIDNAKLYRKFEFKDFCAAWGWMLQVAFQAEKANHHPEWLNVYSRVEVWLTTHDTGGISPKDLSLAETMESLL